MSSQDGQENGEQNNQQDDAECKDKDENADGSSHLKAGSPEAFKITVTLLVLHAQMIPTGILLRHAVLKCEIVTACVADMGRAKPMKKPRAPKAMKMKKPSAPKAMHMMKPNAPKMKRPSASKDSSTPPSAAPSSKKPAASRPAKKKPATTADLDVSKVKVLNVQSLKVKYVIRKPITLPDWNNLHWRPKKDKNGDTIYEHTVLPNTHTGGASGSNMAGINHVSDGPNDGPGATDHGGVNMTTGDDNDDMDSDEGASDHPHVPTPTSSPEPIFAEHAPELSTRFPDI